MPSTPLPLNEEETLSRRLTLPVEDRPPRPWNGSSRWFRSVNVIDLWRYRPREEQQRMIELARASGVSKFKRPAYTRLLVRPKPPP